MHPDPGLPEQSLSETACGECPVFRFGSRCTLQADSCLCTVPVSCRGCIFALEGILQFCMKMPQNSITSTGSVAQPPHTAVSSVWQITHDTCMHAHTHVHSCSLTTPGRFLVCCLMVCCAGGELIALILCRVLTLGHMVFAVSCCGFFHPRSPQ